MDGKRFPEGELKLPEPFLVKIVEEAERNLTDISDYIFASSPQNAKKVKEEIRTAIRSLDILPHRFKVYEANPDPSKVVHSVPLPPFIIYYRIIESIGVVEVLSVRHGARDRPPRFFD
jgi:toxin ParE1/3/4